MKNVILFLLSFMTIAIISVSMFYGCNKTEIKQLYNMKPSKGDDFLEMYLVYNPPNNDDELKKMLLDFNKDMDTIKQIGRRVFLREDTGWDPYDYERNGCYEINSSSVLMDVTKYPNGRVSYHYMGL
ncbi:MAG: hypothetical protein J0M05_00580 [Candidatus Kapabacteria bacterium]|jgi:hypothetical protein|nr:hypothetical protein [Candidatus Kapabacteria bacterium]